MKKYLLLTYFILLWSFLLSQETIKVMTYNLLNFGNYTSYCSESDNSHIAKAQYLKTIIEDQQPDIFAVCELSSNIFYMNYILGNSLNVDGSSRWARIEFTNMAGSNIVNGLFYDRTKFSYDPGDAIDAVNTGLRDINIYKLKYLGSPEDIYLHIVIVHLKAGNTASDREFRANMVNSLMNRLANYSDKGNNFLIMGDFNLYTNTEPAFRDLTNPSDAVIAFYDPVDQLGNWHNNISYTNYHTQSTHTDGNSCFATGGLDDRFDLILVSSSVLDGSRKVRYKDDSYKTVGQDGIRLKGNLIYPENTSLPGNIIEALYNMSDHLPVVAEFYVGDLNSSISLSSDPQFYARVINPVSSELKYEIKTESIKKTYVNIYNPIGEKLFSEYIIAESGNYYSHDIGYLPAGIYILTFEAEGFLRSYKILKNE